MFAIRIKSKGDLKMKKKFDVVVAGAGVGGICAALAAARQGAEVLVIERDSDIGGTGVHSPVGLICKFWDSNKRPVTMGIHKELFPQAYQILKEDNGKVPVYDAEELKSRYAELIGAEKNITVWVGTNVCSAEVDDGFVKSIDVRGSNNSIISGKVFIDATADGNLSYLAGAEYKKGRDNDGKMMTATLTFILSGFEASKLKNNDITAWEGIRSLRSELDVYYKKMKSDGFTSNLRSKVLCFPYPDGKRILFNSTSIKGVDPTIPETVETAMIEGKKQIAELIHAIRCHPAFREAKIDIISKKLGVREGRRITGDYILKGSDCLEQARFKDMVSACAYNIDIHDPDNGTGGKMKSIPGTGYYHIPYRSLIAKGYKNLLLGSRCISGDFDAHSSYRVMSSVAGFAEAAGVAASIYAIKGLRDVREVASESIRCILKKTGQFIEGEIMP